MLVSIHAGSMTVFASGECDKDHAAEYGRTGRASGDGCLNDLPDI
jgi:hypothetical protein